VAVPSATTGISYSRLIVDTFTRHGSRIAFEQDGRSYSYAAAADLMARMRAVLSARGIGAGSGMAALGPNRPEIWLAQAATWLAGGRYSGLHPLGSLDDHVFLCDDAEVEVLVVDPMFAERGAAVAERAATVKHLLTLGPADVGEDLLALAERAGTQPLDAGPADEEDICWLQYTGGTTGRPKGVMLPHRAMVAQAMAFPAAYELPDRARYLAAAPITHAAVLPLLPTLMRGGTVLLHKSFDPQRWLTAVQHDRVSYSLVVPTMVYALLDHGAPESYDLSSLHTVAYGAAPMTPPRLREAHERIGPVLTQAYGQTECVGMATALLKEDHDPLGRPTLLASCGRPVLGTDVRVLDEDGQEVPTGEVGEICVRSRCVMNGYWKQPGATAEALAGGWLHTADMGRRDPEGYLYIVDRKKDMIISGGFNIYPKEIEDVLAGHPDVATAAVIGVPHPTWGEAVKAVVVGRPGATVDTEALVALVKQRKGAHHAPKSVDVVEALPVTPVGKVDKKVLRGQYWSDEDRQVH
jgi:fatty-acyl-CoA synthase